MHGLTVRSASVNLASAMPDLSIALCLRDDESQLPDMAQAAGEVTQTLAAELAAGDWRDATAVRRQPQQPQTARTQRLATQPDTREQPSEEAWVPRDPPVGAQGDLEFEYELIALDEGSRDNTLSVLSILHAKIPELRSVQELRPGTAIRQAARTATGRVWLLVDAPFEAEHGIWAARQVFCGDPAALIPGEVLAVSRNIGQAALGWFDGGLVGAQREVEKMLAAHGQQPAWSPPRNRSVGARARLFVRGRMNRVGLGRFDRR